MPQQQCLLDNLWIAKQPTKKLQALHALSFYFSQLNNNIDSKNFVFYFVLHGRQPGIYFYWPRVIVQIENFPNPAFKGFYTFQEALDEASKYLPMPCYVDNHLLTPLPQQKDVETSFETAIRYLIMHFIN